MHVLSYFPSQNDASSKEACVSDEREKVITRFHQTLLHAMAVTVVAGLMFPRFEDVVQILWARSPECCCCVRRLAEI
jgi:hypothetical protein